jgi:hypothetical protein
VILSGIASIHITIKFKHRQQ